MRGLWADYERIMSRLPRLQKNNKNINIRQREQREVGIKIQILEKKNGRMNARMHKTTYERVMSALWADDEQATHATQKQ